MNSFDFIYFPEDVKYTSSLLFGICEISKNLKLETEISYGENLFKNYFSALRLNLLRKDKKIAVFGIFKSGKSTLINAILNQKILPSRTNRATGVITSINYDSKEYAKILFESILGSSSEIITIDKINQYILLDTSDVIAKPPENIKKVEIKLPDFFLPEDCYLTDTPGLLDNEKLTELSYGEIETSDLVIIVLRADKLLSEKEREAINYVNNLLKGNVIFVINRMGVVCDDDEEEEEENKRQEEKLLKLANKTLQDCGNSFIGKPVIITTDALSILKNDTSTRGIIYRQGVNNLKQKLRKLFNSLFINLKSLVDNILEKTKVMIDNDDTQWANKVKEEWKKVNTTFVGDLELRINNLIDNRQINAPTNYYLLISELNLSNDFGSNVTNFIGGSFALKAVRKIGNVVFNSNWREEHFDEAKKTVFQQQEKLLESLNNYFTRLEESVKIYEIEYQPILEKPQELLDHYSDAKTYAQIISQSKQFLEFMIKIIEDIKDWNKQFEIIWQPFANKIIYIFSSEYTQKLKLIKSNEDLNNYINDIVKFYLKMWQDEKEDQGIWLEILMRECPIIGQDFVDSLNKMEINILSKPVFLWSIKEIGAIASAMLIGIIILLWGQNMSNFNIDLITLRQGIISVGFIYTVFSVVKKIREKRIEDETNNLIKKLTSQIEIYHEKLGAIIRTIN